jgi:hypothetical protein
MTQERIKSNEVRVGDKVTGAVWGLSRKVPYTVKQIEKASYGRTRIWTVETGETIGMVSLHPSTTLIRHT